MFNLPLVLHPFTGCTVPCSDARFRGFSKGDYPFMFISPFDTKNFFAMYEVQGNRILKDGQVVNQQRDSYSDAFKQHYDLVNQYADSPYASLFENNAYANLQYHPSFVDDLASIFGSDSQAYSTWLNDRDSNLAAEDAKVLASIQANQYNSPAEQSARMRAAGLNPDILGTGDVASASEVAPDETPISGKTAGIDEVAPIVNSIGSFVVSAVTKGFDIYRSMSALDNELDSQTLSNFDSIVTLAKTLANNNIPSPSLEDKTLGAYITNSTNSLLNGDEDTLFSLLEDVDGLRFRSLNNRKLFKNAYFNYVKSSDFEKELRNRYSSQVTDVLDIGKKMADPGYSPYAEEVTKVYKPFYKLMIDVDTMKLNAALSQSRFDWQYWNNRQGSVSGMYDQGIHRNQYLQSGYKSSSDYIDLELKRLEYKFTSVYRNMVDTLYKDANNGSLAAQAILMGMFTGRSLLNTVSGSIGVNPAGKVTKSIGIK